MKKIFIIVLIVSILTLTACGDKKCYTCGKSLADGGYQAFGNYYCDYCFMHDLGID